MKYFIGGYTWEGGTQSHLDRFINEGLWECGTDKYQRIFSIIKEGDYFALKSTFVKTVNGQKKSFLKIAKLGIVKGIINEKTLSIEWLPNREFELTDITWYAWSLVEIKKTEDIQRIFSGIMSNKSNIMMKELAILQSKHQIILQGPPGTGKTRLAKEIAFQSVFGESIGQTEKEKKADLNKLEKTGQYKLVQFHPAYSYEDFVRGITAKSNGQGIEYNTENKILADFAKLALENYNNSQKELSSFSYEKWISTQFEVFKEQIQERIEEKGSYSLKNTIGITSIDRDCFRYGAEGKWTSRIKFEDFLQMSFSKIKARTEIESCEALSKHVKDSYNKTYYFALHEQFQQFLLEKEQTAVFDAEKPELKNYVLVIDEINRANLPAVLGELIYALEYRGEKVESMYEIDKDNGLILPPNLYIIGTMNTADRSVGHIDYAIRRRFAFVDVLPSKEPIKTFALPLFKKISELFIKDFDKINWDMPKLEKSDYLAADFRPEYVWLGHSYFITNEKDKGGEEELRTKLRYEILPILKEYINDGILNENARTVIDSLSI
jgi:MoxR-like ATPase